MKFAGLPLAASHHVQRCKTQSCAVDYKPYIAIERDIVEVAVLHRDFDRLAFGGFPQRHQFRVPEQRIVVDGDLGIYRHETARLDHGERVDLDQGGIQFQKDLPQSVEKLDERRDQTRGEPQACAQTGSCRLVERSFPAKGEPLEPGLPVLNSPLDIIAPLRRGKNDDFGGRGSDEQRKIKALQGLDGGFDQDPADKMAGWRRLFGCETAAKQIACRGHDLFQARRQDARRRHGPARRPGFAP